MQQKVSVCLTCPRSHRRLLLALAVQKCRGRNCSTNTEEAEIYTIKTQVEETYRRDGVGKKTSVSVQGECFPLPG